MMNQFIYLTLIFFGATACSSGYKDQRSRSKHYRDGQFHNPVSSAKSFWSFLKMRWSTTYAEWPKWVDSNEKTINPTRVSGGKIHVSHINHSTVLVQAAGLNILTDPIYSERCSPVSWAGPKRVRHPGVQFDKLPPVDVILLSHDHYDHLDLPTLEKLVARDNPLIYLGLGMGRHLSSIKGARYIEMDWWEQNHLLPELKVHFVPVQHFSGRTLTDRNSTLWGGYVFEVSQQKIYFGGDTGYGSHFKETAAKFGAMDIALLPIGAYEPRDFMAYAHINPAEAVQAHLDLRAKTSIGVHYGTFQLTAEKIDDPIKHLQEALHHRGVSPKTFLTPEFGQVIEFSINTNTATP